MYVSPQKKKTRACIVYVYTIYIYIVGYNGIINQHYAMMYNLKLAISFL